MSEDSIEEIRESVDEAKAPGTFSITSVLKDRGYPKMQVVVSVDEESAYEMSLIKQRIEELDESYSKKEMPPAVAKQKEELLQQSEELAEKMRSASFTFHLEGISEGKRMELYKQAKKKYPVEYEKDIDISTGKMEKTEKESPERDALYTDLLWEAYIRKIVNANGDEQVGVSYSDVRVMRDNMPISSTARLNESIEKLRVASAVFMLETDEDFLAKPSPGTSTE